MLQLMDFYDGIWSEAVKTQYDNISDKHNTEEPHHWMTLSDITEPIKCKDCKNINVTTSHSISHSIIIKNNVKPWNHFRICQVQT